MRIIEIEEGQRRNDCVALMCAEIYGMSAGLAPLVRYAQVVGELLPNHAARVVALAEGELLRSVALLVLEESGKGLSLELLTTPLDLRGKGYARELVERLATTTAMRVTTADARLQGFFTTFGFSRWLDDPSSADRTGLNALHGAASLAELPPLEGVSDEVILRTFKHDPATFEHYKQQFINGVENAPRHFSTLN